MKLVSKPSLTVSYEGSVHKSRWGAHEPTIGNMHEGTCTPKVVKVEGLEEVVHNSNAPPENNKCFQLVDITRHPTISSTPPGRSDGHL